MKYIVYLVDPKPKDQFVRHPVTQRELVLYSTDDHTLYECEADEEATNVMEYLARNNPGKQVVRAEINRSCQMPYSQEPINFVNVTEKGMLPE